MLTRQNSQLVRSSEVKEEMIPVLDFIEFSTHPMLRQSIDCPREFCQDVQRGEVLSLQQWHLAPEKQTIFSQQLLEAVRREDHNLDFITQYLPVETNDIADLLLGRIGVRQAVPLFRLTESQNVVMRMSDNTITFEYPTYTRTITFQQGLYRGHIIHTMSDRNNNPVSTTDCYCPAPLIESAMRTCREDCNKLEIAFAAQARLRELGAPEHPVIFSQPYVYASEVPEYLRPTNEETRQRLRTCLNELHEAARHFNDSSQSSKIKSIMHTTGLCLDAEAPAH